MENNSLKLPQAAAERFRSKERADIKRSLFQIDPAYAKLGSGLFYYLRTYGCQANERDSETIAGIMELLGFKRTSLLKTADVIILNSCAIRKNAEDKVLGELGNFKRLKVNGRPLIALCGCMAQEEELVKTVLKKYPQVDLIFGTHNIYNLPALLASALNNKQRTVEVLSHEGDVIEELPVKRFLKHKAWVNIIYGCNKFCSYCIVPYTRGKERSRLLTDIVAEVKDLQRRGYKEVTLLGQNVNAYGLDLGMKHGFADLLAAVAQTGIPRIRYMTSHPRNFDNETIATLASYPNLMPYCHLPLQSGNDAILKQMNRRYNRQEYQELFTKLKKAIPNCTFTTDIIVGFPNESEEAFNDTLTMVDFCQYDNAFTFIYSPREGTPAAKIVDNIPLAVKEERLQRLNAKVNAYAHRNNQKYQDQVVEVLVDGVSKRNKQIYAGYTPGFKLVNFQADHVRIGDIVKVKITACKSFSLDGIMIEENH